MLCANTIRHNALSSRANESIVPSTYVIPKNKDPINKYRMITSYYNYPAKRLLKMASKALTFLFRNLNKKFKHFTLHKLHDAKRIIEKIKTKWKRTYKAVDVIATDLKQMYTFLDHNEIKQAMFWLLSNVHGQQPKGKKRSHVLRKREIFVQVQKLKPNEASYTWSRNPTDETIVFSLNDLYHIVEYDLENSYSKVGNQIFKQTNGCPIGGLISSLYGNLTCAHHEYQFLNKPKLRTLSQHVEGIRQIDDLIVFIGHENEGKETKKQRKKIKQHIEGKLYKGGLEAEIEKPFYKDKTKIINHFAGHEIHTQRNLEDIYTKTLNANRESILKKGKQTKIRYPNNNTYANPHIKSGFIIGALNNIKATCTYREDFTKATMELTKELMTIGYRKSYILKIIEKLAHTRPQWKVILTAVRCRWNKNFTSEYINSSGRNVNRILTTPLKYRASRNQEDAEVEDTPGGQRE